MRMALSLSALASVGLCLAGADSNPYLKLKQTGRDGKIRLTAENISGKPIVAYVVAIERGNVGGQEITVNCGVYSGQDKFAAGESVEVAEWETRLKSGEPAIFVDYIRLADGSTWGDPVTAQGKEVAARFEK